MNALAYDWNSFVSLLLGSESDTSLNRRALHAVMLASALVATFILIESQVARLGYDIVAFVGACASLYWAMYLLGRRAADAPWLIWIYLGATATVALLDWLFVGGQGGVAILLAVALAGAFPLMAQARQLAAGFLLLGVLFAALAAATFFRPTLVPPQPEGLTQVLDNIVCAVIIAGGFAVVTSLVMAAYRKQRVCLEELNDRLAAQNQELQAALQDVRALRGMIPICCHCKKIRNDSGFYEAVEEYISHRSDVDFSHTICPECEQEHYGDMGNSPAVPAE